MSYFQMRKIRYKISGPVTCHSDTESTRVWVTIYKQAHTRPSKCLLVERRRLLILKGHLPLGEFHHREYVLCF